MNYREKSAIPIIESVYHQLTSVERCIADFFLKNKKDQDFSAKRIASLLSVSEASLSRFAKKCGFKGYREFIFLYEKSITDHPNEAAITESSIQVLNAYQELLTKSYSLINEDQVAHIATMIAQANRVFVCGTGSSGIAGEEMAYRFMRIGIDIDSIQDVDIMRMLSVCRKKGDLVIGMSLSGDRKEILDFLRHSKKSGATTIMITANLNQAIIDFCDEVLLVPALDRLNYGNLISPQFPLLVMTDILYAGCMRLNRIEREHMHDQTLEAILGDNNK